MSLRERAKGECCQIRLPGVCNFNRETTVGSHFRLIGLSGMGMKSHDCLIAWGCSACHAYCDTHHDDATQLALAHGVMRTMVILFNRGIITEGPNHVSRLVKREAI